MAERRPRRRRDRSRVASPAQAAQAGRAARADPADAGRDARAARRRARHDCRARGALQVSEAALYRHFASKAQMFEGLIDFIEHSVFTLVNQIAEREPTAANRRAVSWLCCCSSARRTPGMTRVMVGDALVFENERLLTRMNQFFDRVESQLRQSLRAAADAAGSADTDRGRQCARFGAHGVLRRSPAALRALGLQAHADRTARRGAGLLLALRRRRGPMRVWPARRRARPRRPGRLHSLSHAMPTVPIEGLIARAEALMAASRRCCRTRCGARLVGLDRLSLPQARRVGVLEPVRHVATIRLDRPEGGRAAEGAAAAQHRAVRRRPARQQRAADGRARHRQEFADQGLPE